MNIERATGIVLRTRPLTDTSLIVHWLTPDLGRLATVAKGARRPKSPFRGQIDLFYTGRTEFRAQPPFRSAHLARSQGCWKATPRLRPELAYLQQASYCAALIEQTTETETPAARTPRTIRRLLRELPQHPPRPATIFAFEMKLLEDLGQQPNLTEASLSPGAKQLFDKFISEDWRSIFRLRLSPAQEHEIEKFLHGFLIYHLGRLPRGRAAALETGA